MDREHELLMAAVNDLCAMVQGGGGLEQSAAAVIGVTLGKMQAAESERLGPRWWHCDTHGPGTAHAWGCPECVREMRAEISRMRVGLNSAGVALTKLYPYSTDDAELADLEQTRTAAIAIVRWALGPNVEVQPGATVLRCDSAGTPS